ncbi:hypothetical protein [Nocardia sp. NPDC052566]|uniref:hypothetical protein n=1 Tax=Nocardia sp. NPDC052566 TaxID=3364330 RepID=UPI0037CA1AD0
MGGTIEVAFWGTATPGPRGTKRYGPATVIKVPDSAAMRKSAWVDRLLLGKNGISTVVIANASDAQATVHAGTEADGPALGSVNQGETKRFDYSGTEVTLYISGL